jgi:hypothetical protein
MSKFQIQQFVRCCQLPWLKTFLRSLVFLSSGTRIFDLQNKEDNYCLSNTAVDVKTISLDMGYEPCRFVT